MLPPVALWAFLKVALIGAGHVPVGHDVALLCFGLLSRYSHFLLRGQLGPHGHLALGFATMQAFFTLWHMEIDLDKSYCWAIDSASRQAFASFPNELGGSLSFGSKPRLGWINAGNCWRGRQPLSTRSSQRWQFPFGVKDYMAHIWHLFSSRRPALGRLGSTNLNTFPASQDGA